MLQSLFKNNPQVDVPGFEAEMAAQRARSKDSREEIDLTSRGLLSALATSLGRTQFVGYSSLQGPGHVQALLVDGQQVQEAGPGECEGCVFGRVSHCISWV